MLPQSRRVFAPEWEERERYCKRAISHSNGACGWQRQFFMWRRGDSIVLGVFSPLRDKRLPRGAFTRLEHLAPVSLWLPLALFARVGSTRDIYSVCPIMPRCPCTVGDLAHGNVSQQRIGLTLNFK